MWKTEDGPFFGFEEDGTTAFNDCKRAVAPNVRTRECNPRALFSHPD